jgi:hypothetical protein
VTKNTWVVDATVHVKHNNREYLVDLPQTDVCFINNDLVHTTKYSVHLQPRDSQLTVDLPQYLFNELKIGDSLCLDFYSDVIFFNGTFKVEIAHSAHWRVIGTNVFVKKKPLETKL